MRSGSAIEVIRFTMQGWSRVVGAKVRRPAAGVAGRNVNVVRQGASFYRFALQSSTFSPLTH